MTNQPEQDRTPADKILNLEDLRRRVENAREVAVDASGRLIDPTERQEGTGRTPTKIKTQRWFSKPWYLTDPARLVLEQRAVRERFPQFELRRDGEQLVWVGTLETNCGNTYELALYYPHNFPNQAPKVYPIKPAITVWKDQATGALKHQFNDGSLCLFHPNDRTFEPNTTAATLLAISAYWLFAYETWRETGAWVGQEAD